MSWLRFISWYSPKKIRPEMTEIRIQKDWKTGTMYRASKRCRPWNPGPAQNSLCDETGEAAARPHLVQVLDLEEDRGAHADENHPGLVVREEEALAQ
jgi:hypothetical protein